jgi:hypothetical protein
MPTTLPEIRYTNLIEELGPLPSHPWKVHCVADTGSDFYCAGALNSRNDVNGEHIVAGIEVSRMGPPDSHALPDNYPYNALVYIALRQYQPKSFWSESFAPEGCSDDAFILAVRLQGVYCPIFQCNSVSSRGALRYAARALRLIDKNLEDFLEVPCNNMGSNGSDFLKGELVSRPANANHLNKPW